MAKKKKPIPKKSTPPRLMTSAELCKSLVTIAAFSLDEYPAAQMKVYEAVRRLQMLDAAAEKAGLLQISNGHRGKGSDAQ